MKRIPLALRSLLGLSLFILLAVDSGTCLAQLIDTDGNVTDGSGNLIGDSTTNVTVNGVRIGNSSNGTLEVTGGLKVENTGSGSNGFTYLGYGDNSAGTATISGSGSLLESHNSMIVGRRGMGTLNVVDGGKVESGLIGIGQSVTVGSNSFGVLGTGVVNVTGMNSAWEYSSLTVGDRGIGTINIDQGGKVTGGLGQIGQSGGTGTVNVIGKDANGTQSIWELSSAVRLGLSGGNGILNVLNGGQVRSALGSSIGHVGGDGAVTIAGDASRWINSAQLNIGSNANGEVNIEAGGTLQTGGTTIGASSSSGFANSTSGIVRVSGTDSMGIGSLFQVSGSLEIGYNQSGIMDVESGGRVTSGSATIGSQNNGGRIGDGAVKVSGAGSEWILSGNLVVGQAGTAKLEVLEGGVVRSVRGSIASGAGMGAATVSGHGSRWENSDNLQVGNGGDAVLNVLDGGAVTSVGGTITGTTLAGNNPTATISGIDSNGVHSSWDSSGGTLTVGSAGKGELHILAGGQMKSTTAILGWTGTDTSGTVNVSGSGSRWDNSADLSIGHFAKGEMKVIDGAVVSSVEGYLGRQNNDLAVGTATVAGLGSQWNNSGDLYVGHLGSGTLEIHSGGVVSNTDGHVGFGSNRTSSVTVDGAGSQWNSAGSLFVGIFGTGNLDVSSGASISSVDGIVGLNSSGFGEAKLTQGAQWNMSGGSAADPSELFVGYFGTGILDIESGSSVVNENAFVGIANGGEGTVNISGDGSTWDTAGDLSVGGLRFGQNANDFSLGKSGTLNVSGGTVNVGGTMKLYEASNESGATGGLVNLTGGKLDIGTLDLDSLGATENFNMTGGRLVADTILGDFQQDGGTLAPGDSPGLTEIQGNYDMNGGIIEFEFAGGANPFVDYDSIKVEGVATLSGMLDIDLIYPAGGTSPFAPVLGDSFLIVDADGGIQGMPEFDFSGAGLSSGLAWNTNDFSSTGRISIIAAVPEPTGALLLALTSCSILLRRRRSC